MNSPISVQICGYNKAKKRSKGDFYPTPPEATQALLDFLKIPKDETVLEPAAGEGDMAEVIEGNGYKVHGIDIQWGPEFDFLTFPMDEIRKYDWIITNPPFSIADDFIKKSFDSGKPFAMLLKSQYWHAKKRQKIFNEMTPDYILPLTWRPDFNFKVNSNRKSSPLMDVMWCVWTRNLIKYPYPMYIPLLKPENESGEGHA